MQRSMASRFMTIPYQLLICNRRPLLGWTGFFTRRKKKTGRDWKFSPPCRPYIIGLFRQMQCLIKIGDHIIGMFPADAQAHEVRGDVSQFPPGFALLLVS